MTNSKRLVAVIDDEEAVRRAFGRLLRAAGYEAEMFSSGEDFLAALETRRPACAVLDLHMPAVDGFEVQSRMTRAGHSIPVVVVTGFDTPEARGRAMSAGAAGYLRKPVDDQALLDAIEWALAGSKGNGS